LRQITSFTTLGCGVALRTLTNCDRLRGWGFDCAGNVVHQVVRLHVDVEDRAIVLRLDPRILTLRQERIQPDLLNPIAEFGVDHNCKVVEPHEHILIFEKRIATLFKDIGQQLEHEQPVFALRKVAIHQTFGEMLRDEYPRLLIVTAAQDFVENATRKTGVITRKFVDLCAFDLVLYIFMIGVWGTT
jgi:hypothetical protein